MGRETGLHVPQRLNGCRDRLGKRISEVITATTSPDPHNYDKHDIVSCNECGESFVCLCNRATECPCAQVNLSRDEAEWIGWQTGNECVCQSCLLRFRDAARGALAPAPIRSSP